MSEKTSYVNVLAHSIQKIYFSKYLKCSILDGEVRIKFFKCLFCFEDNLFQNYPTLEQRRKKSSIQRLDTPYPRCIQLTWKEYFWYNWEFWWAWIVVFFFLVWKQKPNSSEILYPALLRAAPLNLIWWRYVKCAIVLKSVKPQLLIANV